MSPACSGSLPMSLGSSAEIAVVTDARSGDSRVLALLAVLQEPLEFARGEARFRATVVPSAELDTRRHSRCLALLTDLGAPGSLAGPLRRLLSPEELEKMRAAPFAFRVVRDAWARGQCILVVHARASGGGEKLAGSAADMTSALEEGITGALIPVVLAGGEERALERRLARDHGFTLRVPAGWLLGGDPARGVARLYRVDEEDGSRFLLLVSLPADRAPSGSDSLLAMRNRLGGSWGDGDQVDTGSSTVRSGLFQHLPATVVEGTWRNEKYAIGGPFRSYAFVRGSRFFLVDIAVFRPRDGRLPILREAAAVAATFRLAETS